MVEVADDAATVLTEIRSARTAEHAAAAAQLRLAAQWAALHEVDDLEEAAGHVPSPSGWGTAVPLGGPGCPLVDEFCVAELAAALGLTTEAGRDLLGETLELVHRLPRTWARVQELAVPAWRARRIARATMHLPRAAARFVDAQVAHAAHRLGPVVLDRLVVEAELRFDPSAAAARAVAEAEERCFTVDHRQVSSTGTSRVHGVLDLADALDLEAAVAARAGWLAGLGCEEPLDVRRALAVGALARADLELDLAAPSGGSREERPVSGARQVVLHLHLSADVLAGEVDGGVGRVGNTGDLVTADQVRAWCATPGARVVVRPVLDLDGHVHTAAYEVPDRLAEQARLRDLTCAFPWCERRAARCDTDHVVPHAAGGATCTENLAPLCRRHHRLKTHHGRWSYLVVEPGRYLWTSPHGYRFLRDHTGTRDVTPRPGDPPDRPPDRPSRHDPRPLGVRSRGDLPHL